MTWDIRFVPPTRATCGVVRCASGRWLALRHCGHACATKWDHGSSPFTSRLCCSCMIAKGRVKDVLYGGRGCAVCARRGRLT